MIHIPHNNMSIVDNNKQMSKLTCSSINHREFFKDEFYDETFDINGFKDYFSSISNPVFLDGKLKTGCLIYIGTNGNVENLGIAKDLFMNPDKYNNI